jgi:anaerobic carbon-monoxide dehydrogenase iron sulfur subunit
MACSVRKTGRFSSRSARIWVETEARVGKDVPHVCRQNLRACRKADSSEPRCIEACPLARDPHPPLAWEAELGAVVLRPRGECMTCLACVAACRFDAIRVDPSDNRLIKCDLCGGEPECVTVCVTEAIQLEAEAAEE